MQARIGSGFDIHRTAPGVPLILGGVEIPSSFGLQSDTDGDVVLHALMDAVLAAAGLPDIGIMFPPAGGEYRGVPSAVLAAQASAKACEAGFTLEQADITIHAEAPKLAPYYGEIRARVAELFGIGENAVSVKARTMEGLGDIGEGRAIAAHAFVLGKLEAKTKAGGAEIMLDEHPLGHTGKIPDGAIVVNVDGGSRGNPGPAGCAAVTVLPDGEGYSLAEYIGETTNNVAEYKGVLLALRLLHERGLEDKKIVIQTDSSLVYNQLIGKFKVKDGNLRDLARQALRQVVDFADLRLKLVPREENTAADAEVNAMLDAHSKAAP
jgi:2-C-methyl-D-erythritol 2,4-cyclodiphosphate synthase